MRGALVQRGPLPSSVQAARATYIFVVEGYCSVMKSNLNRVTCYAQIVTAELTKHYFACLSPSIMRVAVMREGVAAKLVDAMMAALGNCFECLSSEDVCTLAKLYTVAPGATMMMADAVVGLKGPDTLAE